MANYDSFRAARWIRFTNLILQSILFLSLFAGLNYIALNHAWRFDLTENRRYSLSAETRAYLADLERNVRIYVTITADGTDQELEQARRDLTALLREYTYHTRNSTKGRIEVRTLDIYQSRREAEALGLDQPNQVVLVTDRHRRVIPLGDFYTTRDLQREGFRGEATLTSALLENTSAEKKKIYFLSGTVARDAALETLRRRLSGLRDELLQLPLPGDSPLWYAFGFNRPDDPATPGVPEHLALAAGAPGSGTLIIDWDRARRATGYRVKLQVPGEPEPRLHGLFPDDQTTLTGLPLGVLLTVTIIAHNASGDGPESAPGTITLS